MSAGPRSKRAKFRPPPPRPDKASIRVRVIAPILVVLVILATLWPVCAGEFTSWDDALTVARNPTLNPPSFHSVKAWWSKPYMDLYIPVTYMAWGAIASFAGTPPDSKAGIQLNPHFFHAANLLVHLATALVVYQILVLILVRVRSELFDPGRPQVGRCAVASPGFLGKIGLNRIHWIGCAGSILFAIHPVQVEPVAWISGLKDLLCGFFSVLALWRYLASVMLKEAKGGEAEDGVRFPRFTPYLIATIFFALALLSKPTAVVVPFMAATLDLLVVRRAFRNVAVSIAPWLLLAVACAIGAKWAQPAMQAGAAPPFWLRPLVAADALRFYLLKLIWPAQLTIDYGRTPGLVIRSPWIYLSWLLPAVAVVIVWLLRRRRILLAGALLFAFPLIPLLGLVRFDFQRYSTVADHYLYLPMLGVSLIVAFILARQVNARWTLGCLLLVGALAVRSWLAAWDWRDSATLFTHVLTVNPRSALAFNSLAVIYQHEGAMDKAISYARQAIALAPQNAEGYVTLATELTSERKFPEAILAYRQACDLVPDSVPVLNNLSGILASQGRFDEAMPLARRAMELDPGSTQAHLNLGTMLYYKHDLIGAQRELNRAVALGPENISAHNNLAAALAADGQRDQAIEQYRTALRIDPRSAQARHGLAQLGVRADAANGQ